MKGLFGLDERLSDHAQAVFLIVDIAGASLVLFRAKVLNSFALVHDFDEAEGGG